jgi:SAM-dependent methyltransferase
MQLNESYWTKRYLNGETGWDIGYAAPAIIRYFEGIDDKDVHILIPGGGNAYEAQALFEKGFKNVEVLDLSKKPLENLKARCPEFPDENLLNKDFFEHEGSYDYVIEQTFFCALPIKLRLDYVHKMNQLIKEGGKLVGLLFNIPLNQDQPPFGGHKSDYEPLFQPYFYIQHMDISSNSIPQRLGNELFIEMSPLKV